MQKIAPKYKSPNQAIFIMRRFNYNKYMNDEFLRGVNFGGWLVLEKWMTPTLFNGTEAIDEFTFMQTPGAKSKIDKHRKTFINEEDFKWLKANGINAVRIPVGYWVLNGDAPFLEASQHLDWAMDMARKYQLKVLIDIHGLPGSQNGNDHSGRVGRALWYQDKSNRQASVAYVSSVADRYKNHPALWGIQVINEPRVGLIQLKLRSYYRQIYKALSKILPSEVSVVISDAFSPRLMSGSLKKVKHTVVLDVHLYHMATPLAHWFSIDWFMRKTKRRQKLLRRLSKSQPIIIGEWSGVMKHETMRNVPDEKQPQLFADYVALQQEVFHETAGWFYWNYKTEHPGQWNFRSEVESGLIDPRR